MACFIIGAGSFYGLPGPVRDTDTVIAADGGWRVCRELSLTPSLLVADFDSLDTVPEFGHILRLPVEKDDTDMLAAVRLALGRGCREIHMFGGTGGRLDHTLANIQTLHFVTGRGGCGYLYGSGCAMTVLSGETVRIPSRKSGDVSLFALDSTVHGVTIRGLKYTLEYGDITPDFPIGVSNSYIGKRAEITVKHGCALLYFDCDTALPLERQRLL